MQVSRARWFPTGTARNEIVEVHPPATSAIPIATNPEIHACGVGSYAERRLYVESGAEIKNPPENVAARTYLRSAVTPGPILAPMKSSIFPYSSVMLASS